MKFFPILLIFSLILPLLTSCKKKNTEVLRIDNVEQHENILNLPMPDVKLDAPQQAQPFACFENLPSNEVIVADFDGNNALAHFWNNGTSFDIGRASALKYVSGRRKSPWSQAECHEKLDDPDLAFLQNQCTAWSLNEKSGIRFPLPELEKNSKWILSANLRPKVNPSVAVRLNGAGTVLNANLSQKWSDIHAEISAEQLKSENILNFSFPGSYFEGNLRVGAKFRKIFVRKFISPNKMIPESELAPVFKDNARLVDKTLPSWELFANHQLSFYHSVESPHAAFKAEFSNSPWAQDNVKFQIAVSADGVEKSVAGISSAPGDCFRTLSVDLSPFARKAVKITVSLPPSKHAHSRLYLANARIVNTTTDTDENEEKKQDEIPATQATKIIAIAIDALRADLLFSEKHASAMPFLRSFAAKNAKGLMLAAGSGAVTNAVSLLFGQYAASHQVLNAASGVPEKFESLALRFEKLQFKRFFFSNSPFVTNARGIARHFSDIDAKAPDFGTKSSALLDAAASKIVEENTPYFAYIHLSQLRLPHGASDEKLAKFKAEPGEKINPQTMLNPGSLLNLDENDLRILRAYYNAEANEVDDALKSFIEKLPSDAAVLIFGNHGEALGEDSLIGYGNSLSPAELITPFVLKAKGLDALTYAGLKSAPQLHATLLKIAGIDCENCVAHPLDSNVGTDFRNAALSTTHAATADSSFFYLVRNDDNESLQKWRIDNMNSRSDVKDKFPVALRSLKDLFAYAVAYADKDKNTTFKMNDPW